MIEFRVTRKRSRKVQSTQFEKLLKEVVQTNGIFLFNLNFKNKRVFKLKITVLIPLKVVKEILIYDRDFGFF